MTAGVRCRCPDCPGLDDGCRCCRSSAVSLAVDDWEDVSAMAQDPLTDVQLDDLQIRYVTRLIAQARLANALAAGLLELERQTTPDDDWAHCAVCGGYLDARMLSGQGGHLPNCGLVPLLGEVRRLKADQRGVSRGVVIAAPSSIALSDQEWAGLGIEPDP